GLTLGTVRWASVPAATDRPEDPRASLRRDLGLTALVAAGLTAAAAAGSLAVALGPAGPAAKGAVALAQAWFVLAFVPLVSAGLAATLTSAGGGYALALAVLAARGRLPWRCMAWLDEAYRSALLRRVGPAFQFRHAELQDRLAATPARPSP
ncbi:hypothetical protein AB0J52_24860, partial [Spirillospora sp. NPDC049652]